MNEPIDANIDGSRRDGLTLAAMATLVALLASACMIEVTGDAGSDEGSGTQEEETAEAPSGSGDEAPAGEEEPSYVEVTNPRTSEADFQAGVAILAYGNEPAASFRRKSAEALDRLARLHVNSVSLVWPIFQGDWRATEIGPHPERTPSEKNLGVFIDEAKLRGFTVLLRPVLDEESLTPDGKWRGSIEPADLDAWFASYERLIMGYARVAEEGGGDVLAVGTELTSLQDERPRWRRLIREVRSVFDGQVTYATNWDAIAARYAPRFVGALDFLSVDAFFPLEVPVGAGVGQMARGWRRWVQELRSMDTPLRRIVFTEVGVRAQQGAHRRPYVWEHAGEASPETQRRYYAATCRVVADQIGGLYWWMVDIHHATEAQAPEDFSPLGKPAEREIARCFRGAG